MPSQSLLQILGSRGQKEARYAPIFTDRFFVGYWSNRNPLRSPLSTFYADGWHLGGTDALIAGTNVELSPRLTLCRRPGNIAYSTATIPTPPLTFYPFELFGGSINLIVDTATTIYTITPSALTSIFTKGTGAQQANFLGIGGTLYFGDGVDQQAYTVTGGTRNWGIAVGAIGTSVAAYAGAGTDTGGGHSTWSNPGNIVGAPDSAYATNSLTIPANTSFLYNSNHLDATQYGFSLLATDIPVGVQLDLTGFTGASFGSFLYTVQAILLLNGAQIGTSKTVPLPTAGSPATVPVGGPSDLWGLNSLSYAQVNNSTFGVRLYISGINRTGISRTATADLDAAHITIYRTGGPAVTATGSGVLTGAYSYVEAYGNSASGQVSSTTPPSATVNPSSQEVQITLTASTDPQVNQIWLFRTAAGGSIYLNLPSSPYPNSSGNVLDNAPDSQLNILQQAPINSANNPPPAGALDPVFYLGVVWVHVGNAVYFSRTPSAIVGITQESFPPANVFTFPETVIRKIPFSSGLLIQTTANIYIILGNNTSSSVLYSAPFLSGYGVVSWNAVWTNGSIIYFFTSDNRLIKLDPSSGVEDMGFPIGDQLATLNPANVYVTYYSNTSNDVALYVGDGSTGWYRCNPNQAPDGQITGPVWSPKATIVGGLGALVGLQTSPGVPALMMGGTGNNEPVLVRDSTYSTFSDNGTAYASNFTIGSVVLAQPGQMAICRFITADFVKVGTSPIVSVLLGEISGTFENISGYVVPDPPYLPAASSLYNNRYYFKQTVGGGTPNPVVCRHLQIRVDYSNDTVQNEILSMTINGAIFHEK